MVMHFQQFLTIFGIKPKKAKRLAFNLFEQECSTKEVAKSVNRARIQGFGIPGVGVAACQLDTSLP
jgi:hypothetical protein